jgi:hypothetical protein
MHNGNIQFVDLVAKYQHVQSEVDAAMTKVCAPHHAVNLQALLS